MNGLYLSDGLVRNIKLCREGNMYQFYKESVADGLCGIELAIDEVETPRTKKLLQAAKDAITTFHYLVDLMSEEL